MRFSAVQISTIYSIGTYEAFFFFRIEKKQPFRYIRLLGRCQTQDVCCRIPRNRNLFAAEAFDEKKRKQRRKKNRTKFQQIENALR